ncbi:hypothetical protein FN846DRAFT_891940 [Sphaerosporella brunnea]|uniref:ABC transmembrane type-1 domain-containing protein n=1 Tax=Sphaerosporella brunnea TaxID=1250544 RepID=A0A5J5ESH4_9PEZI|nr:hypothetical protein FN846DRAFT_891940 [Sphaerosporella brunnea]
MAPCNTFCVAVVFILFGVASVGKDAGDLASSLISDFSPFLALFGERFAQRLLSESTSWIDGLVFALAPLGMITAIVGAIRVGGQSWLKALIGRARESFAIAEIETMNSTSHEVCECWNGNSVVRVMGVPPKFQVLFSDDMYQEEELNIDGKDPQERTFGLFTLETAITDF